jgi:Amidase
MHSGPTPDRLSLRGTEDELLFKNVSISDAAGPLARSVADPRLAMSALGSPIPKAELKGSRIAFYDDKAVFPVSGAIKQAVGEAARALESAGCEVQEFAPPDVQGLRLFYGLFQRRRRRTSEVAAKGQPHGPAGQRPSRSRQPAKRTPPFGGRRVRASRPAPSCPCCAVGTEFIGGSERGSGGEARRLPEAAPWRARQVRRADLPALADPGSHAWRQPGGGPRDFLVYIAVQRPRLARRSRRIDPGASRRGERSAAGP